MYNQITYTRAFVVSVTVHFALSVHREIGRLSRTCTAGVNLSATGSALYKMSYFCYYSESDLVRDRVCLAVACG